MLDHLVEAFARPMSLPFEAATIRLVMAVLLGGAIGWEREIRKRAAGLRTHMLISLAAACFTLVAMNLVDFADIAEAQQRVDPLRLIEAVTAGVAFLAAGSIIISHGSVRGLTTGASMWLCGAIGLCCGTGDLRLAMLVTVLALTVLTLVRALFEQPARDEEDKD